MQSRYPSRAAVRSQTAGHYAVFVGFSDLFEEFQPWLGQTLETITHGHLFAPERVEFANDATVYKGAMSDSAQVRDYNCGCFLRNLMWNSRGTHQSFHYRPFDTPKAYLNFVNDRSEERSFSWLDQPFRLHRHLMPTVPHATARNTN